MSLQEPFPASNLSSNFTTAGGTNLAPENKILANAALVVILDKEGGRRMLSIKAIFIGQSLQGYVIAYFDHFRFRLGLMRFAFINRGTYELCLCHTVVTNEAFPRILYTRRTYVPRCCDFVHYDYAQLRSWLQWAA
jgi:hypothetical protein